MIRRRGAIAAQYERNGICCTDWNGAALKCEPLTTPSKPSRSAARTRSRSSARCAAGSPGGCWPRTIRLSLNPGIVYHALIGEFLLGPVALVQIEPHAAQHVRRLGVLNVRILDNFEPVAPGIEKIEERPFDKPRAGGFRQLDDPAAVVDDKADMASFPHFAGSLRRQRQIDELVAHVDEGVMLA